MEILNVLFKGVEVKTVTWCKAFTSELKVEAFINAYCELNKFDIKSYMGWNEDSSINDYRVEDMRGNSYYFVIYRQQLID